MTITTARQIFFEDEATRIIPKGCQCIDRSGSCDWCYIYYNGVSPWEDISGQQEVAEASGEIGEEGPSQPTE